jgi:hypothetical protein
MPRKKESWFTNVEGASEILNRNPRTIGKYVKDKLIDGSTKFGNNKLIPMSDIARVMGTEESTVVKVAKAKSVPLWKCK